MKKNVAIIVEHELRCDVPGIWTVNVNTTIPGTQQRLCFAHRGYATVNGRRSQASAEKVPVRAAGREKSGALKYKTRTQKYLVLVCQVPGIDVYRYFFALILLESWA